MSADDLLSFGPYLLDVQAKRLTRDGVEVSLATRQLSMLCLLASNPGRVFAKDALIAQAWDGVIVTTGSVDNAVYEIRRDLPMPDGAPLIETRARRGVQFVAPVTRVTRRQPERSLDATMQAHREWIEGRAALQSLHGDAIVRARCAFEGVVERLPDMASAHVGLANACALQFEMTRTDGRPDVESLAVAHKHALEARRLDPKYGEAWATLGFVLERLSLMREWCPALAGPVTRPLDSTDTVRLAQGKDDALAAHRESIRLEPDNWRHHLRLAACGWGEERLRHARRTLALLPGLGMAHWLAATVLVARGALAEAENELRIGLGLEDAPANAPADASANVLSPVALHWLLGLLLLARGNDDGAQVAFGRELALEGSGHLYARECAANTWYALGALRFRRGDRNGAREAFLECVKRVPRHPFARAALGEAPPADRLGSVDGAVAQAVYCAAGHGNIPETELAAAVERAVVEAPPGNAGWLLPVEPMINCAAPADDGSTRSARLRRRSA